MEKMRRLIEDDREGSIEIGGIMFGGVTQILSNSIFLDDILDPSFDAMKQLKWVAANLLLLAGKPNVADYFPFLRPFNL
ncbi:hypothetical protein ACS0TY_006555 [Phlomoides rotata]